MNKGFKILLVVLLLAFIVASVIVVKNQITKATLIAQISSTNPLIDKRALLGMSIQELKDLLANPNLTNMGAAGNIAM